MARGQFTVRVKEELAALRPATPAERRALLAGLLRFTSTLHLGGTVDALIEMVKQSVLRCRGGAGFPTGMKWQFVDKK